MSLLIIALPEALFTDQALPFMLLADGSLVEAGETAAAQLPRLGDSGHEVVALAPPHALSWHPVQLPPGVHAKSPRLRAVLDGLLEDQLLDPPAELHLALAESEPSGSDKRWVAACDRRWLAMAVQGLEAAGCRVSRVLPEWAPGPAHLHLGGTPEEPKMLLRSPQGVSQLAFNDENLAWALPEGSTAGMTLSAEPQLLEWAQARLQREVEAWSRHERWALAAQPRWDLSRGLLMRKRTQRSPLEWFRAPRWRAARWATLGLVGVQLVGVNALAWSHSVHMQSRREQMRQMLVQTFPHTQAQPVIDPPAQMQRELERLRTASTQPAAGDLVVMLGEVLAVLPPGRTPQALDYATGQLRLKGLQVPANELQALASRLQARGYTAQTQGADLLVRTGP